MNDRMKLIIIIHELFFYINCRIYMHAHMST